MTIGSGRIAWLVLLLTLGACASSSSGGSGGTGGGTGGLTLPITTMTQADFHAIGVAAHAPQLAGHSIAQALGASEESVNEYFATICKGNRPMLLPNLTAFPDRVPAYEEIFAQAQSRCTQATAEVLDRERGHVANSIAHNEEFLANLAGASSGAVGAFCDGLEKSEKLDSTLIGAAAGRLGVEETGAKLLEIGVELLIKNCAPLLARVDAAT